MTTDERLENLERELSLAKSVAKSRSHWLMAVVIVGAILFAVHVIGTSSRPFGWWDGLADIVRAHRYILQDKDGRYRATLTRFRDEAGLYVHDEDGNRYASVTVDKYGPGLALGDEGDNGGNDRATLTLGEDEAGLYLRNEDGNRYAILTVDKDGTGLTLGDENGNGRATLTVDKDGPALRLYDENGKVKWQAP